MTIPEMLKARSEAKDAFLEAASLMLALPTPGNTALALMRASLGLAALARSDVECKGQDLVLKTLAEVEARMPKP